MNSQARNGTWRAKMRQRGWLKQPPPNDWLAVIEQHHRMVQTLTVVTPVSPAPSSHPARHPERARARRARHPQPAISPR